MPFAIGGNGRIRTNISAENAYNSLEVSSRDISLRQLRLSTGLRINSAADDVAGYITSRALQARNGALKAAINTVGDAQNVTNIVMDSLDNINQLVTQMKDATSQAASGALGTDEKVALAKAAYRLAQQIQTVVDSTVFSGSQLLSGSFTANFIVGGRVLNIHPALLPKFGGEGMYGMNVHKAVIESGEKVSGATVHLVDSEYDRGRILMQREVPVIADDTPEALAARVLEAEHLLYKDTLKKIISGEIII
jgi:folate-dependent phosphoribosylglycinamide formyltransferase PurN